MTVGIFVNSQTEVIPIQRKSAVLSRSSLACLKPFPTMNLTVGCAHACAYCYTQGYSIYPGAGRVQYYENAYDWLVKELPRKRKRPTAIYFSPSSDLFQPIPEVLDLGLKIIRLLFDHEIGVAFLTKGRIPEEHLRLLLSRPELVRAQIGLITLDERILKTFEPGAPPADVRLEQAARLIEGGVSTQVRLDPILPGLTDDNRQFDAICQTTAATGVRRIAASVLFTRPRLIGMLKRKVTDPELLGRLLADFEQTIRLGIHAEKSSVHALPAEQRRAIFDRLRHAATSHNLRLHLCGCKNPDIVSQTCHISGRWNAHNKPERKNTLFPLS